MCVRQACLRALTQERKYGSGEGRPERSRFDRADMGGLESSQGLCRKVVVAARLHRGRPLAEASKRERVVTHRADVVLRLPDTPPLDARARVERVDDAQPKRSAATDGVGMKRSPATGGVETADCPAAVSPNRSWNRGPPGRN